MTASKLIVAMVLSLTASTIKASKTIEGILSDIPNRKRNLMKEYSPSSRHSMADSQRSRSDGKTYSRDDMNSMTEEELEMHFDPNTQTEPSEANTKRMERLYRKYRESKVGEKYAPEPYRGPLKNEPDTICKPGTDFHVFVLERKRLGRRPSAKHLFQSKENIPEMLENIDTMTGTDLDNSIKQMRKYPGHYRYATDSMPVEMKREYLRIILETLIHNRATMEGNKLSKSTMARLTKEANRLKKLKESDKRYNKLLPKLRKTIRPRLLQIFWDTFNPRLPQNEEQRNKSLKELKKIDEELVELGVKEPKTSIYKHDYVKWCLYDVMNKINSLLGVPKITEEDDETQISDADDDGTPTLIKNEDDSTSF